VASSFNFAPETVTEATASGAAATDEVSSKVSRIPCMRKTGIMEVIFRFY